MLGFVAFADKCDLCISNEVDAAGWYKIDEALTLLKDGSIAMQLFKDYLATKK